MCAHCMYPLILCQCLVNFTSESRQSSMYMPYYRAATRKVARTPWVTAHRQAQASTLPTPWAQVTGEKTSGGPRWETLPSLPMSPKAEETMNTRSLSQPPARTAAAVGTPSQTSPTSGERECSLLPPLLLSSLVAEARLTPSWPRRP